MGYKIEYEPEKYARYPDKRGLRQHRAFQYLVIGAVLVVICLGVYYRQALSDWLLPGDPEMTRTALSDLLQNVRAGNSFPKAIDAFCRYIISNAAS